jgi:transcriptional regulator with XRE-family HTH domain
LYGIAYMSARPHLGQQIREARLAAGLSLRALADRAQIPASTIEGYEGGSSVPAEKLARLAHALGRRSFETDAYLLTVNPLETEAARSSDQMNLDFRGEYQYARASVRINPGRITITVDAAKSTSKKAG